jgi:hypothetical protein
MKNIEQIYIIILGAVFFVGAAFGSTLTYLLSEDCKTRQELCVVDIKQNQVLKKQLTDSENKCFEAIDKATDTCVKDQKQLCGTKLLRIQNACNDLDCAQCRR